MPGNDFVWCKTIIDDITITLGPITATNTVTAARKQTRKRKDDEYI